MHSRLYDGPRGSSRLEPSQWLDLFFPFRNVCFTENKIHFFQHGSQSSYGQDAIQFFDTNKEPPEIFIDWSNATKKYFDPEAVLHNTSMEEWMTRLSHDKRITLYHGTSLIAPPHLPHNNFHVFNDLIIPLFRDALLSGAMEDAKDGHPENDNNNNNRKPKRKESIRQVFLLRGNENFVKDRVIMFDAMLKVFHRNHYPFEDFIHDAHDGARAVCFERYIWAQSRRRRTPFYSHYGRFDEDRNNQWKGVVPALRDAINKAHNISVPTRESLVSRLRSQSKPRLIWASRTGNNPDTCERCIVNENELLEALRGKFEVELLPIFDRKESRQENLIRALELMSTADLLGGMHGAGLGHTLFLQPGTALFEMKDRIHWRTNLFMNMANLNHDGVGYYAYDTRPTEMPGRQQRFYLNETAISTIAEGLSQAWQDEVKDQTKRLSLTALDDAKQNSLLDPGTCEFPTDSLADKVSSFESSRCYLVRCRAGRWKQASNYDEDRSKPSL